MAIISVEVQADHLERLSKVKKPLIALAELIWNGFDADATEVSVNFDFDFAGGLQQISVRDNGTGMTHQSALDSFRNLGGSWKKQQRRSREGKRLLHGRGGKGRFRAFALGNHVTWTTTARIHGNLESFSIVGTSDSLGRFEVSDPVVSSTGETGTEVTITEISKNFPSLKAPDALQELAEEFAIYLQEYPDLKIRYDGHVVDPAVLVKDSAEYQLKAVKLADGGEAPATLQVIEWGMSTERHLFLCDADGFSLDRLPPGIQAPGFNFTAYLKSDFVRKLDDANLLDLEELNGDLGDLIEVARNRLREHFRRRSSSAAKELVQEWKANKVYPYEGEPQSPIEEATRQVFDVVALNIHEYLPDFRSTAFKAQRLSLTLLREALEDSPAAVKRILNEVLDLPTDKQVELAELLDSTSLTSIISASKLVSDRLNFLRALEYMVFDAEAKKVVLERRHLHKILEKETWIFGEEFNMSASDKSLNEVLRKHLAQLGREPSASEPPVLRADGREGIVDLMLSRTIPQPRADQHEHLVIELKRPSQDVNSKVLQQVKDYAFAVADDERFADTQTNWSFWAVSTQVTPDVRREASQRKEHPGLAYDDGRVKIWVKSWAQVIDGAKARMRFFEQSLRFDASEEAALRHLRRLYEQYLPSHVLEKVS